MSGPIAYKDFVAPPPGPTATDEDLMNAVKALATHYQALSPSVPLSGWSPSPAPQSAEPTASDPTAQHAPRDSSDPTPPAGAPSDAP